MTDSLLPKSLGGHELTQWLKQESKESFTHSVKTYFTEEELIEMKDDSFQFGSEQLRLTDLLEKIKSHLTKGSEEELNIDLPATEGIKKINAKRQFKDRVIAKGYSEEEVTIYGIPSEDGFMYYFDQYGTEVEERRRKLTTRENHEYNGFLSQTHQLSETA